MNFYNTTDNVLVNFTANMNKGNVNFTLYGLSPDTLYIILREILYSESTVEECDYTATIVSWCPVVDEQDLPITYDVRVGTYSCGDDVLNQTGISETNSTPFQTTNLTTYYWSVRAFDDFLITVNGPLISHYQALERSIITFIIKVHNLGDGVASYSNRSEFLRDIGGLY